MRSKSLKSAVQYCYNKYLNGLYLGKTPKLYSVMYSIWRRFFTKFDPEIKIKVGKKFLFLNLSHQLPVYYYKYPNYDRALPRICKKLKEIDKRLFIVDIGANIGDTVYLITDTTKGSFLCVEGDEKYLPILEKNIKQISTNNHIRIEECYCGNETEEKTFISRTGGTAKIIKKNKQNIEGIESQVLKMKSLDRIIRDNPNFGNSNLLKIDTDGFEIDILNSGKTFIKDVKPLLYFEFTPELYIQNNQNQKTIWNLLRECGYKEALFYNNFGQAIEIINISDQNRVNKLVNKIDNKNINYYDILVYHASKNKYSEILKSELNLFI